MSKNVPQKNGGSLSSGSGRETAFCLEELQPSTEPQSFMALRTVASVHQFLVAFRFEDKLDKIHPASEWV